MPPTPDGAGWPAVSFDPPGLEARTEIDELPGWSVEVTVGPSGTVDRLVIEPQHVRDESPPAVRVCSQCGHIGPADPRQAAGPRTKAGLAPAGGITTRMLRKVRLAELVGEVRRSGAAHLESISNGPGSAGSIAAAALGSGLVDGPRPGRPGREDRDYAEVAAMYVEALASHPRAPVKRVAELRGEEPTTIRDTLYEARNRGLLSNAPSRGRSGGVLTAAGRAALTSQD